MGYLTVKKRYGNRLFPHEIINLVLEPRVKIIEPKSKVIRRKPVLKNSRLQFYMYPFATMSNLTARVLSSVFLFSGALLAVFFLRELALVAFLSILGALLTYEYIRALKNISVRINYGVASTLLVVSIYAVYRFDIVFSLSFQLLAGMVSAFAYLLSYAFKDKKKSNAQKWLLIHLFWIVSPLCIVYYILSGDPWARHLIFILLIVSACDCAAYFGGKRFGKTPLMKSVSPGKTIEGAAFGVVGSALVGMAYVAVTGIFSIFSGLLICVVLSVAGQVGDLTESKFKRICKIKDSSNLIPGHGGFLDRLDSYLIVFPVYLIIRLIF